MRAAVLHAFGSADNLRYETVPDPEPGPGQVRIAVRAAGVHLVETMLRRGPEFNPMPETPELPAILGGEVSGIVESVGPGVDPVWVGRAVVTPAGTSGGYAELAVADLATVHPVPAGLSHETAVAMVVTGTTALEFLDVARLTPADVVLVTSAAGGVGQLVVQYAVGLGARVVGVAGGPEKTATVRALGADTAVDYRSDGWPEQVAAAIGGRSVTALLDGVGGEVARAALGLVAPGGRYVTIGDASGAGWLPDEETLAGQGITWTDALDYLLTHRELSRGFEEKALAAAAAGRLVPDVRSFPLAEAARAHAALESRATAGKVVLVP
ncbi:zinc-binding dehydrogenase [Streptomyces qinzhouensis]|uniref:Zinc-binding dehydrogenase n=1 Tax=Streptomyces qinzhouensis TaxID=2599401 RepID=A0A5B8JHT6_9ACTN|nr:zinc-binding dehydrogenase [Streptomyces qinzhouensis]QDY79421.1 zinc-binding dehydrogenase [Streptomyces qinzhouensis]